VWCIPSTEIGTKGIEVSLTLLSRPSPTPSQAGRLSRVCVHANCQGMARRDSMPPVGFLLAGLRGLVGRQDGGEEGGE
jgi:hypothetical protein